MQYIHDVFYFLDQICVTIWPRTEWAGFAHADCFYICKYMTFVCLFALDLYNLYGRQKINGLMKNRLPIPLQWRGDPILYGLLSTIIICRSIFFTNFDFPFLLFTWWNTKLKKLWWPARQDSKVARASASLASFSTYNIKFALEEQF